MSSKSCPFLCCEFTKKKTRRTSWTFSMSYFFDRFKYNSDMIFARLEITVNFDFAGPLRKKTFFKARKEIRKKCGH